MTNRDRGAALEATLPSADADDDPAPPTALGRYQIVGLLGRGGMGIVVDAYDPSLDRRVAIKLLRNEMWGGASSGRDRLAREAQAMAKLNHPNVVVVYEVGKIGEQPFLAMERVDGETLRSWQDRARSWREIVAIYITAGRGLAAAHAEGLVHRDFKPENVLVGRDGRPRVTDFGLVLGAQAKLSLTPATDLAQSLSIEGVAVGTPAYMSPEHWSGEEVDARSDQFSFCIALWEALYTRRPFPGDEAATLRTRILAGSLEAPTASRRGPRRLELALRRGLALRPQERWPTLAALLDELERIGSARTTTRWMALGGIAAAIAATALVLARRDDPAPAPPAAPPPPALPRAVEPASALTSLGGCSFSPAFLDDTTLAFDLTRGGAVDLYTLELGGAPRQRTATPGWEWMSAPGPTPHEVVFMVQGSGSEPSVDQLDLVTDRRTTVYTGSAYAAWAAGAYYLALARSTQIHRLRGQTDEVIADLGAAGSAVMLTASRDGAHLAVIASGKDAPANVCVIETETGTTRCPLQLEQIPRPARPRPARVTFGSTSNVIYYEGGDGIYRLPLDGGAPVRVLTDHGAGGITVSPSGAAMVFSSCRSSSRLVTAADEVEIRDTEAATSPVYSRTGALAYVRTQTTLVVRGADHIDREIVARTHGAISDLAFSPDGQAIAYQVNDKEDGGIYLVAPSSPRPNRLTEDPHDTGPVVVADAVYFTRTVANDTPQLVRIGVDGSNEQVVLKRPRIALGADARGRILTITPARDHLYWWDPATAKELAGPVLRTTKAATVIELSPDGRWLVALAGGNGRSVFRMPTTGPLVQPELVRQLADDVGATSAAIGDDGRVVITLSRYAGELWIARSAPGAPW